MQKHKRLLAMILSVAMTLSSIPITVVADGTARNKTLATAQGAGTVTAQGALSGSVPGTSGTWSAGTYALTDNLTATNIAVSSGEVIVYIPSGKTLTINSAQGTKGLTGATNPTVNNYSFSGTYPDTQTDTSDGLRPNPAVSIASGATLTITGPGNLVIIGGVGGEGFDELVNDHSTTATTARAGGDGSIGGVAVENKGTFKLANTFSGFATITGGKGGKGGDGQGGRNHTITDATHYYGGAGGYGGMGGEAFDNSGTIIFNQDNENNALNNNEAYAVGKVNVKGGQGGVAGQGGQAGQAVVKMIKASTISGSNQNPPNGSGGKGINSYQTSTPASTSNDDETVYPTTGGVSGTSGKANYGILNGTVKFESGVTTIEGGNSINCPSPSSQGTIVSHTQSTDNDIRYKHSYNNYTITTWTTTNSTVDNPAYTIGSTSSCHTVSSTLNNPTTGIIGYGNTANYAAKGVTFKNNGGTSYLFHGDNGVTNPVYAGTTISWDSTDQMYVYSGGDSKSVDSCTFSVDSNTTGSLYVGGINGYDNLGSTTTPIQLSYLEAYITGDNNIANDGDFNDNGRNFYVLNKDDFWTDANGNKHTSAGVKVNGIALSTRDLYVNPQGYLYLSNVSAGQTIEMDVAIGATRKSNAGDNEKEIKLSNPGSGVYRFTGKIGGTITARWALDSATDGVDESYDSSFDVNWLQSNKSNLGENETIEISTAPQLAAIAWAVNNGVTGADVTTYKLANNINLGSFDWTPIGTELNKFKGTFDGDGKIIYNVRIDKAIDGVTAYGLFGYVEDADIKNFTLTRDNFNHTKYKTVKVNSAGGTNNGSGGAYNNLARNVITVEQNGAVYAGSAVGHATKTKLSTITATGLDVSAKSTDNNGVVAVGGIVGFVDNAGMTPRPTFDKLTVTGGTQWSLNTGLVKAEGGSTTYAGGIAGHIINANIEDANTTNAAVSATGGAGDTYAGGFVGYLKDGDVSKASSSVVSLTATNTGDYLYRDIKASGANTAYSGGFVGYGENSNVTGITITGVTNITATSTATDKESYAGGAVGYLKGTDATRLTVNGNTITTTTGNIAAKSVATSYSGGLVGKAEYVNIGGATAGTDKNTVSGLSTIKAESTDTTNNFESYAGGAVGYLLNTTADNQLTVQNNAISGTNVAITASSKSTSYSAGLIGKADYANVTSNTVSGAKTISAKSETDNVESFAGGAVGLLTGTDTNRLVLKGNTIGTTTGAITATANANAYAGGLVGKPVYVNIGEVAENGTVTGNSLSGAKEIKATSTQTGKQAFAGGAVGLLISEDADKPLLIRQTTITGDSTSKLSISADSKATSYSGGMVGLAQNVNIIRNTATNVSNVEAKSEDAGKNAFAGGVVGHLLGDATKRLEVDNNTIGTSDGTIKATSADTAYTGGLVGKADYVDVTNNKLSGTKTFTAESTATGLSYAGGAVGYIIGTSAEPAIVKFNEIDKASISGVNVTATSGTTGSELHAYAGGIVGFGQEFTPITNHFLNGGTGTNNIKAIADNGSAYAGGHIGFGENTGAYGIAISDTVVSNLAVYAGGKDNKNSALEAYAGGVVGQVLSVKGLEVLNVGVLGTKNSIEANANLDAFAGRVLGNAPKATIIGTKFDNHNGTGADVNVTVKSLNGDVFAGGVAGSILQNGVIGSSSLAMTNINATTGKYKDAWVAGVLGYGEDVSIGGTHVNGVESGKTNPLSSKITINPSSENAANVYSGGIAGEIINTNPLNSANESTYKMNNAINIQMNINDNADQITAGGLFGKVNNALIGVSYARGYSINNGTDTGNGYNWQDPHVVAGVVGELRGSELIAVYGVGDKGVLVETYPGMYHTGGGNKFSGTYAYHSEFAVSPSSDGNSYLNTYYADGDNEINYLGMEDDKGNAVGTVEEATPYYVDNGLKDLKVSYNGKTYKYTGLTAVTPDQFKDDGVNDSIFSLVHFYKSRNGGQITTPYEARLGVTVSFSLDDINYKNPTFAPPQDLSLAVSPGLDYGHIKQNVEGKPAYSTYYEPKSYSVTPKAKLIFTAEEQATLPKDIWFYSFDKWTISPTGVKGWDNGVTYTTSYDHPILKVEMPDSSLALTANFLRHDNYIRAQINTRISEVMARALEDATLKDKITELLEDGKTQEASDMLLDAMVALQADGTKKVFNDISKEFDKWVGTTEKTPTTGNIFAEIYPKADLDFKDLLDSEMVVKQIVRETIDTVMEKDLFVAGSHEVVITDIMDKAEYVDIGSGLFGGAGLYNDYVKAQDAFEKSGVAGNATNNQKVGIKDANGMTVTIDNLFIEDTKTGIFGHGVVGGVYISYTKPTNTAKDKTGNKHEDKTGESIWENISKNSKGEFVYTLDEDRLEEDPADSGNYYIYLKEVDANGYEVVTRIKITLSNVAYENEPVNDGTDNEGIGNGMTEKDGRVDERAVQYGPVMGLAENKDIKDTDTQITKVEDVADSGKYYQTVRSDNPPMVVHKTDPSSGAYAEGIYVEVDAAKLTEAAKTKYADNKKTVNGKEVYEIEVTTVDDNGEFKIPKEDLEGATKDFVGTVKKTPYEPVDTENNNRPYGYSEASFAYNPVEGITVKSKYVDLLGEINAAKGDGEVKKIVDHPLFGKVMGIDDDVITSYKANPQNDTAAEGEPEVNPLLTKDNTVDLIYKLIPPAKDGAEKGYPSADELAELFTYITATQELVGKYEADPDGALKNLKKADQDALKSAYEQAKNLLSGKDPKTGKDLTPAELEQNLDKFYKTAETMYKLMQDAQWATIAIMVVHNNGGKASAAGEKKIGKALLAAGTLFADGKVVAPQRAARAARALDRGPLYPKGDVTTNTAVAVKGDNTIKVTVEPETGYYYTIAYVDVKSNEMVVLKQQNGDGKNIYTLPAELISDNQTIAVVFHKNVYEVTYPQHVISGEEPDPVVTIGDITTKGTVIIPKNPEVENDKDKTGIKHGDTLVLEITPKDGFVLVPGADVKYKVDGGAEQTAKVNPNGTVSIPNVTGPIEITDVSGAVKVSDSTGLGDLIDRIDGLNYKDHTPETWKNLQNKLEDAKKIKDKGSSATPAEIKNVYDALLTAEATLIPQHKLDLTGTSAEVIDSLKGEEITGDNLKAYGFPDTVTSLQKLQNGVVKVVDDDVTSYYVQDGFNVSIDPKLEKGKTAESATYKQGSDAGKKATIQRNTDGTEVVVISNIRDDVSNVVIGDSNKAFNAVLDGDSFGSGSSSEKGKGTYPTLPDMTATIGTGTPNNVTATVKDDLGNEFVVSIPLEEDEDGNIVPKAPITVTPKDGTTVTVTVPEDVLADLIKTTDDGTKAITVDGDKLGDILDNYNKTTSKPKAVIGDKSSVTGEVAFNGGSPANATLKDENNNATGKAVQADVPTFTVKPPYGKHVDKVSENGKEVTLPNADKIAEVLKDGEKSVDGKGNVIHTLVDPNTGDKVEVKKNKDGEIYAVAVTPGTEPNFKAEFNTDLKDPDYGNATLTWKDKDNGNHVIGGSSEINTYPFDITQPKNGSVKVKGTEKGSTTHGEEDVVVTLTADSGAKIDPTGKVTITVAGVQGEGTLEITGTVEELFNRSQRPDTPFTMDGISRDEDGKLVVTGEVKITLTDPNEGPINVSTNNVFRPTQEVTDSVSEIKDLLDKLKDLTDLGHKIKSENTPSKKIYDKSDDSWEEFENSQKDAYDKLYDKLSKPSTGTAPVVGGAVLDSIMQANDPDTLQNLINNLLGNKGNDKLTPNEIVIKLTDAYDDLYDAILGLKEKDGNTVVILPELTGEVGTDGGLKTGTKPEITGDGGATKGGSPTDNLVITNVVPKDDKQVDGVIITVTDKDSGKSYDVFVPENNGADLDDKNTLKVTDKNGNETAIIIPNDNKGANYDSTGKEITVPADTIDAIIDALTGGKDTDDSNNGVVSDVAVVTGKKGDKSGFDGGNATVDAGIKDGTDVPKVEGITGGLVNEDRNNIVITPIKPKDGYEYKGIEVAVKDKDGNAHTVFIPKDESNTTGSATPDGFTTTITANDLEDAIKAVVGDDLDGVIITDVKVVSDAVDVDISAVGKGNGLDTTTPPAINKPTGGSGSLAPNEDLTINNVKPKPGYNLSEIELEITDPNSGESVWVTVPVNGGLALGEDGSVVINAKDKNDKPFEIEISATEKGGKLDNGTATVPSATIDAIIDALRKSEDNGIGSGVVTGVVVSPKRDGIGVPVAEKGIDTTSVGDTNVVDSNDQETTAPANLKSGESIVISDIEPKTGYEVGKIDVVIKNPITGKEITVKVPSNAEAEKEITVPITYVDSNGKEKDLSVTVTIPSAITKADESGKVNVTIPEDAIREILKEASKAAAKDEFGERAANGITDFNGDIESIKVNSKGADSIIDIPSKTTNPNDETNVNGVGSITVVDDSTGNAVVDGGVPSTGNVSIVIDNLKPEDGHKLEDTVIEFTDKDGKTVSVHVPLDKIGEDGEWKENDTLKVDGADDLTISSDLANALNNIAKGTGTSRDTEKITIPSSVVTEIAKGLGEAEVIVKGTAPDVTEIVVSAVQDSVIIKDGDPKTNDGVASVSVVSKTPQKDTTNIASMDPRRGIEVTAGSGAKVDIRLGGSSGVSIIVDSSGNATVETASGKKVEVPEDLLNSITTTTEGGKSTISVSGSVIDAILEAADLATTTKVTSVTADSGDKPVTSGKMPSGSKKDPSFVAKNEDLVVDNIVLEDGYELDSISLFVDDKEIVIPKESSVGENGNPIVVITVDGTTEQEIALGSVDSVINGIGSNGSGTESVTISGPTLLAILDKVFDNPLVTINEIKVNATGKKVDGGGEDGEDPEEPAETLLVPPAETIRNGSEHGIEALVVKNSEDDAVKYFDESSADSSKSEGSSILVPVNGNLVLEVTFSKDDNPDDTYHKLDTIDLGNGYVYSVEDLENANVLTYIEGGDPLSDMYSDSAIISIDVDALIQFFAKAEENKTEDDFPGFADLTLTTIPQNNQYKEFLSEMEWLLEQDYTKMEKTSDERHEYESIAEKLMDQFKSGGKDELTPDNRNHLIDNEGLLSGIMSDIKHRRDADNLVENISENYKDLSDIFNDLEDSGLLTDPEGETIDWEDMKDIGDSLDDMSEDSYQRVKDAVTDAMDKIKDNQDSYGQLPDWAKDMVDDSGAKDLLDELGYVLEKVQEKELGKTGYFDNLVNDLPDLSDVPDVEPNNDSIKTDTDKSKNDKLSDLISELVGLDNQVKRAEDYYDTLDSDQQAEVGNSKDILDGLRGKIEEEYDDLAELFIDEYLDSGELDRDSEDFFQKVHDGVEAYDRLPKPVQDRIDNEFNNPSLKDLAGIEEKPKNNIVIDKPKVDNLTKTDEDNAIKELEDHYKDLLDEYGEYYTDQALEDLKKALEDAINEVKGLRDDGKTTKQDANDAVQDGKDAMDEIKPHDEKIARASDKDKAINDLTDYYNDLKSKYDGDDDYTDEQLAELDKALEDAIAEVNGSLTLNEVNQAVSDGKGEMDSVPHGRTPEPKPEPTPPPTGGGGNGVIIGGGKKPSVPETDKNATDKNDGGSYEQYPAVPKPGDKVVITVKPDDGYTLDNIKVTDPITGAPITVVEEGYGKYSYTQPAGGNANIDTDFNVLDKPSDPTQNGVSKKLITEDHINYVVGTSADTFSPNKGLTRGEMAQIFFNLMRNTNVEITREFGDVAANAWYAKAVRTLASLGIIEGIGNDLYAPDKVVTRAEFVSLAVRFTKVTSGTTDFPDIENHWAAKDIRTAHYYGWVSGYDDGNFHPNDQMTRAQVVTVVNKMLGRTPDASCIEGLEVDFKDLTSEHWGFNQVMEAFIPHEHEFEGEQEFWFNVK